MAILRRNRRVACFLAFGISALAFLYFADIRFLQKSYTSSRFFDSFPEQQAEEKMPGVVQQELHCKKMKIDPAPADIRLDELWYRFYGNNDKQYPRTEVWSNVQYNESTITEEPKLKVFVVPHSHVDPGWLKTVKEYSNDTNSILSNMIAYMPEHPAMTFTWMEISFFEIWWRTLGEKEKAIARKLVKDGKFQISSGSWTMTDEATPYYWATIDNIVEGHQFLKRELDMTPTLMWSNDPFGYGPTVPYLFRLANVNRTVIQRVHTTIKSYFGQIRALDFYYRQFFDHPGRFDSHVHLLPYVHYDIPNTCGPNSGVCCQFDFKRITHYFCGGGAVEPITSKNVAKKAAELNEQYRQMSRLYKHNVLLVMLGDDFRYELLSEWSQQHDNYMQLMEYMDRRPEWNIEVRFGTFDDYFKALMERKKTEEQKNKDERFPVISGDFFPYNDVGSSYWVGYFTTRPFYKRQDRVVQAMIRAADIATSLVYFSGLDQKSISEWIEKMRTAHRNLAIFQHHDAITGTSKWHVVTDYGLMLQAALLNAAEVVSQANSILLGGNGNELKWTQAMPHFNESVVDNVIDLEDGSPTVLWLYNPLPHWRSELARFRVAAGPCYTVKDPEGNVIKAQLNPIFDTVGVGSQEHVELIFEAKLPPLGTAKYILEHGTSGGDSCAAFPTVSIGGVSSKDFLFPKDLKVEALPQSGDKRLLKLENDVVATYHSASTGYLQAIKPKVALGDSEDGLWKGQIEFWNYNDTRSGAYIFEPINAPKPWPYEITAVVLIHGTVTDEIHSFTNGIYHKEYLRKFSTDSEPANQLLIENTVDIRNQKNTEVVMRILNSDIVSSNNSFLTDSLGFQLMPRQYLPNQRIEWSYYPMSSQLVLQNDDKRLTVLSGQPHGATSPVPGGLEIMLDRILIMDDMRGLGSDSIIRDNVPASSVFRLVLEKGDFTNSRILSLPSQRSLQNLLYPAITFQQTQKLKADSSLTPFVPLQENFPCDTLLLNIRPLDEDSDDGKKKHLLLMHRLLSDCQADEETSCRGSDHKDLPDLLGRLFKNAHAQDCTLSGIGKSSSDRQSSLEKFMHSRSAMEPMEIRSICVR